MNATGGMDKQSAVVRLWEIPHANLSAIHTLWATVRRGHASKPRKTTEQAVCHDNRVLFSDKPKWLAMNDGKADRLLNEAFEDSAAGNDPFNL